MLKTACKLYVKWSKKYAFRTDAFDKNLNEQI